MFTLFELIAYKYICSQEPEAIVVHQSDICMVQGAMYLNM